MFESKTLNLPELAAHWGKSPRQILEHAASMALPLRFNFDGLVIDGHGQKVMQFDADQKREHERLTAFVYESDSKFSRRISGMLRDGETLTTPQAIELRKEVTTAEAKIKAINEMIDVVTRERQKYHYRGQLIATPQTVDEINRLGFARHPIRAYSLDLKPVRLEPAGTPWKERLEPSDMVVSMADVKAIEAAAKPQQTAPATDTAPEQSPATPAPVEDVGASDVWWKIENDIFDMAQNIGASLKDNRNPHSNTKIGEEIAKRIKAMEQKKGKSRNTPSASTVRKMLNGWSIKPD